MGIKNNVQHVTIGILLPLFFLGAYFYVSNYHDIEKQTIKEVSYTYVGMTKDDIPNGYGTMTFKNGDVYKGEFEAGVFSGKGKLSLKASGKIISGDFKNGKLVNEEKPHE